MTMHNAPATHAELVAVAAILAAVVLFGVIFTAATLIAIRLDRKQNATQEEQTS